MLSLSESKTPGVNTLSEQIKPQQATASSCAVPPGKALPGSLEYALVTALIVLGTLATLIGLVDIIGNALIAISRNLANAT